ncbi:glycerol ethanol, ferric requiring protein [Tulasnella sp. JGI-2019a]|nr:glycerol ethanol, ferric requiring protein [Tulasnella sp. JGI-2019a]KAG9014505.1 glycerol ethanol, ferric requiring protein [Tulasnella sp. JGI-2019a]
METATEEEELERIRRYEDFTTIDWIHDSILERNRRLRNQQQIAATIHSSGGRINASTLWGQFSKFSDVSQTWFVVSLAGIAIGVNAALISMMTEWLSDLKMGFCTDGWWLNKDFCCWEVSTDEDGGCVAWRPWTSYAAGEWLIYVLFAAIFSYMAAHLVRSFAKYAAGSGISEIKCIVSGFVIKGYLGTWTLVIKSLTLPLVIASGLSVGKEGPSVHVACCIGNVVARMFGRFARSQGKMREMVTAASAAGVAVAFGSPIGGVLFSIEEMSHHFSIKTMWRSFFCALVATVTLSAMNPFRTGKLVLFQVTYDRDWHFFEIIFFVIIGIFGGLYGVFVIKFNLQVAAFRRKHLANHGVMEAVTLATLTAVVGYFNRFLRIDMTESLYILFRECEGGGDYDNLCQTWAQWHMVNSLLLATILRVGFTVLSYGSKVPAGIFVPSMAAGATFGRMVGIIVKAMYTAYPQSGIFASCKPDVPCITPGTYAFLGAAAALSGVMRITVAVVVIMFELTGALTYILPTMIVLLVTKAVGDFFGDQGIAEKMIKFNGFPYLDKEEHAFNMPVSQVMRQDIHAMHSTGFLVKDIEDLLQRTNVQGFPVVTPGSQRTLLGYIGRTELKYVLRKARALRSIMPSTPCTFIVNSESSTDPIGHSVVADETEFPTAVLEPTDASGMPLTPLTPASEHALAFGPWVNQIPVTVAPQLPLEVLVQLFKRMGPRVILVEQYGNLVGLITIKDVLRVIAKEDVHAEDSVLNSPGALQGFLEEAWMWTTDYVGDWYIWWRHYFASLRR